MRKLDELGIDELTSDERDDLGIDDLSEFVVNEFSKTDLSHDKLRVISIKELINPKFRRNRSGVRKEVLIAAAPNSAECAEEILRMEGLEPIE